VTIRRLALTVCILAQQEGLALKMMAASEVAGAILASRRRTPNGNIQQP
jgi:hypothetical protein